MRVDPTVIPGLLLLAAEFIALAAVGFVVARVALRQNDDRLALAQGLVVGIALWGLVVNFAQYALPGLGGAALGWGIVLTLGAVLAWRARGRIWPRPRVVAGFAAAFAVLFGVALAGRQIMAVPDLPIHLGLAATMQAGEFPPQLPWNPWMPLRYHHGPPLLVAMLTPPFGPDLAFVSELLGVYTWTSLVLLVVTALLQRGSRGVAMVLALLLLATGAWTTGPWTWNSVANGVVQAAVPIGLPEAGLRASLSDIYWPAVDLQATFPAPTLPDVWKPEFTLGYALAYVVLERAAHAEDRSWPGTLTLAGLVGFVGLLVTTLVPVVGVLWAGLVAIQYLRARKDRGALGASFRSGAGLALAVVLLLGGGGAFTGVLDGSGASGLGLGWNEHGEGWRLLGEVDPLAGGVALLGVGPVALAAIAVVLTRRDPLVLTLAAGTGMLALAWLGLTYAPAPWDIHRFAGHARNLALVALLLAVATRSADLRSTRWRYAAGVLLMGLVVWPTVVSPARYLGLSVANGVQLANAAAVRRAAGDSESTDPAWRSPMPPISDRVVDYIRDHTPRDARVLATERPHSNVFLTTGRPNAAGFIGMVHQIYHLGPEYLDALNHLEPEAFRRLEIDYVHATDDWTAALPERAQRWLSDPGLFELVVRDGGEALYRVQPAFPRLDVEPDPQSFEALRSIPPSTKVWVSPHIHYLTQLQVASVLSHTQLLGSTSTELLLLRSPALWTVAPLDGQTPDLVVLPTSIEQWARMFLPADGRQPIWRNDEVVIYAPHGAVAPIVTPPDRAAPPVTVQVSALRAERRQATFDAAFTEHAPERWTGQDWVIVELDEGPWPMPARFRGRGRGPEVAKWFDGLLSAGSATTSHTYALDVQVPSLAVRNDRGAFVPLLAAEGELGAGTWVLALRLRHEWQPGAWRETAFIPVVRFTVSESGEVGFTVFDDVREETHQPGTPATR